MKQLTEIEYNVLMQAIDNAKNAIADDEFIDPYAENTEGYTNESLLNALTSVENKIMSAVGYYEIASVHKEDLEAQGYDVSGVDEATMEQIAKKLGDAYVENSFWIDLGIIADDLGIKQE